MGGWLEQPTQAGVGRGEQSALLMMLVASSMCESDTVEQKAARSEETLPKTVAAECRGP